MFMTYDACAALGVHAHCSLPASVARSGQRYCEEPGRVWVGRAAAMVFYFTSSGESAAGGCVVSGLSLRVTVGMARSLHGGGAP